MVSTPRTPRTHTQKPKITRKRLILLTLLSLSTITFIRLLIITTTFSGPSLRHRSSSSSSLVSSPSHDPLTPKELRLIRSVIAKRSPCNILFFGIGTQQQMLELARSNRGGRSVVLEDDFGKVREHRARRKREDENGVEVHWVEYRFRAGEAYDLLRDARIDDDCRIVPEDLQSSRCKLALPGLPKSIYSKKWDVIIVDGPSGSGPDEPGRMGAIYTAGVIARSKKGPSDSKFTDVIVHNVNRTVEKWFAWEYLCDENLVGSKGRLWHFRVFKGNYRSSERFFCSQNAVQIL